MKKHLITAWLLPILILAGMLGGISMPVSAHQMNPFPLMQAGSTYALTRTIITLSPIGDVKLGNPFKVSGNVMDASGNPIANKSILLNMGGAYLGQAASDQHGHFERQFTKSLSAGTYTIQATTNATHTQAAAAATVSLRILAADVQIQTVPPIPGIPFQLGDQTFYSGEDGMAYGNVRTPGQYRLSILLDQYHNPSLRVEFGRWLEQTNQTYKEIQVPYKNVIQVGLNVYLSVGQNFVDLDGFPVDPARVSELTIRSAQGDVFVFQSGETHWIPASRVTRLYNGLEATQLLYSVLSVMVDGSNVVNQSQQRFYSHPDGSWPISLQLYSMHITSRDALFGFPVGKSVKLVYPNGEITSYPLDNTGSVAIHSLARGNYAAILVGTHGINYRTPVALSRSQTLNTRVITILDLGVVGTLGALVALGLLFYGRPQLIRALSQKNRQSLPETQFAYAEAGDDPSENEPDPRSDPSIIKWS